MKIYAESQIVEVPVYSHVGYLATKTFYPHYSVLSIGIVLLLLGTIISGQFRMYKTGKIFITLIKHPIKKIVIGFVISAIGIIVGILAFFPFGKSTWDAPYSISESHTRMLSTYIAKYLCDMKLQGKDVQIPKDLETLKKILGPYSEYDIDIEDGWYNPLKIEELEYKHKKFYATRSAGYDKRFGTDDDIIFPQTEDDLTHLLLLYYDAEQEIWE